VEVRPSDHCFFFDLIALIPWALFRGMFGQPAKVVSIDEMKATIAARGAATD
jgi:hypothetical protein